MDKRRASVDTDDLRGIRSGSGPPDRSTMQIPVRSRELPSWFEKFVKSDAERDVLLKVPLAVPCSHLGSPKNYCRRCFMRINS